MTGAELEQLAAELGIDAIGAAPVAPYDDTERHIRERQSRGLFADMRFTMARPEVSCHPETLLEGAKTVVAGALCYYREGAELSTDDGRLPRYTWRDEYAELRTRLDALGRRLGGAYRVLVDDSEHVDRAAAVRAGVAFYGKNTMAITRKHGSWVVLGVVITEVEIEPSRPLGLDCGECRLCIDACPTGALDEPGTLDSTRCLSYWTQAPAPIPEEYRPELGSMVYGCDICQEVCPWNRGVEKRRRGEGAAPGQDGRVSLAGWLARDGRELVDEFDRLYVPRNDPRWLRRNALVAAGNVGSTALVPEVRRYADDPDAVLSEAARWALARIAERHE
jgi:epoxyqueuosine reductase